MIPLPEEYLTKLVIGLASMAFLYVSLGRATVLRNEVAARVIISGTIAYTALSTIEEHWPTLQSVAGYAIVAGLTSLLVWRVALQRGKTPDEHRERRQSEGNRPSRDLGQRRNERV